jgi:hypothetical protein
MSEGLGRHRLGARVLQGPEPQPSRGPARPPSGAIRLVWVYPDLLSTYGDRGNLLMLARRARLRGIGVEIAEQVDVTVHGDPLVGIDLGDLDADAAQPGPAAEHQQVAAVTVGAQQVRVNPHQPDSPLGSRSGTGGGTR